MQRPYNALATLLKCRPENIAITTSATVAWQQLYTPTMDPSPAVAFCVTVKRMYASGFTEAASCAQSQAIGQRMSNRLLRELPSTRELQCV